MSSITPNTGLSPKFGKLTDAQRDKLGAQQTEQIGQATPSRDAQVFATAYEHRQEAINTFKMALAVFNRPGFGENNAKIGEQIDAFQRNQTAEMDKALAGVKSSADALSLLAAVQRSEAEFPDSFVSTLAEKAKG